MNFQDVLNSKSTSVIISILLGFGLATLFKKTCNTPDCYVFKGPHHTKIEGQVFKMGNKCYKYKKQHEHCNPFNKNLVEFESLMDMESQ